MCFSKRAETRPPGTDSNNKQHPGGVPEAGFMEGDTAKYARFELNMPVSS